MGKDLHPTIPPYIMDLLKKHNNVKEMSLLDTKDNLFCEVERFRGGELLIHFADEYRYGEFDFFNRPIEIVHPAFILIARPEAEYDFSILPTALEQKIGIGKLAKLLGSLNKEFFWEYKYSDEKQFWER
jgi:hypothetical protein